VGSGWTDTGAGSWYDGLDTAPWQPPGWAFGAAWTPLYALMAVAAWDVARRGLGRPQVVVALGAYAVQLTLNLLWTLIFFREQDPAGGMAVLVALAVAIAVTMAAFARVSRPAAWALTPYLAWVLFASTLNGWIVWA
jgi:translocator protein